MNNSGLTKVKYQIYHMNSTIAIKVFCESNFVFISISYNQFFIFPVLIHQIKLISKVYAKIYDNFIIT